MKCKLQYEGHYCCCSYLHTIIIGNLIRFGEANYRIFTTNFSFASMTNFIMTKLLHALKVAQVACFMLSF